MNGFTIRLWERITFLNIDNYCIFLFLPFLYKRPDVHGEGPCGFILLGDEVERVGQVLCLYPFVLSGPLSIDAAVDDQEGNVDALQFDYRKIQIYKS